MNIFSLLLMIIFNIGVSKACPPVMGFSFTEAINNRSGYGKEQILDVLGDENGNEGVEDFKLAKAILNDDIQAASQALSRGASPTAIIRRNLHAGNCWGEWDYTVETSILALSLMPERQQYFEMLLNSRDQNQAIGTEGTSALNLAIYLENESAVRSLLDAGAALTSQQEHSIQNESSFEIALQTYSVPIVELLLPKIDKAEIIRELIHVLNANVDKNFPIFKMLMDKGKILPNEILPANVYRDDPTPIILMALYERNVDAFRLLLEKGATVTQLKVPLVAEMIYRQFPADLIESVIGQGVKANIPLKTGITPLHLLFRYAAYYSSSDIKYIQDVGSLLVANGVPFKSRDDHGQSALDIFIEDLSNRMGVPEILKGLQDPDLDLRERYFSDDNFLQNTKEVLQIALSLGAGQENEWTGLQENLENKRARMLALSGAWSTEEIVKRFAGQYEADELSIWAEEQHSLYLKTIQFWEQLELVVKELRQ